MKNIPEKFWQFRKKSYLCIRFRPEDGWMQNRESSLKDLHRQIEVVQEASVSGLFAWECLGYEETNRQVFLENFRRIVILVRRTKSNLYSEEFDPGSG